VAVTRLGHDAGIGAGSGGAVVELIGELERTFAAVLYPWRYAIAGIMAIAVLGLVVLARRRRWDLAARRHPGRSLAILAILLAVGLPTGWYLGSPVFIRTELVEPAPVGASSPGPSPGISASGPAASPSAPPTIAPSATPAPVVTPFAPRTIATGTFTGADSFHFGRGTASLIETAPGSVTLRFESFSVRNGPDLFVYLSPNSEGYAQSAVELGRLKATDGAFNYELPAGFDLSAAKSVVIWCKQFAVLFATAPLAAG
jgi:hypothetical protein